jgi:hypothetical protein
MPVPVEMMLPLPLQALGVLNAWVIKPSYMLLALWLLWRLRRVTAPDLRWLWWGLAVFEAGEAACAVNFVVFRMQSTAWELAHDVGMVGAAGLFCMAFLEFLDRRMLFQFVPDKTCALVRFCKECPARAGAHCRFRPLFLFACAAGALLAAAPLTRPAIIDYPLRVSFFGHSFLSYHLPACQLMETRVCPFLAMALFSATLLLLWRGRDPRLRRERVLFSLAVGATLFALFRFLNFRANWDTAVWFDFWEESTEWLAVAGIALILHVFRDRLLEPVKPPTHGD